MEFVFYQQLRHSTVLQNHRNRGHRRATQVAVSVIAEHVEPRMLLSAASGVDAAVGTKELEIIAETWGQGSGPKIDEIRLVGDEIRVFSTLDEIRRWPGEYYPLYDAGMVIPDYIAQLKSEPVTVTVPDRTLSIAYFFASPDQRRSELYSLRTFGSSTLLYRRPNADADSGWLLTDVDPGAGSTVGLDFTPAPAAPQGLLSIPVSGNSGNVTLYFDKTPASAFAGQRFVRRYEIHIETPGSWIPDSQFVAFDTAGFTATDANGDSHSFGGIKSLTLSEGVYSWSVRVQDLPVFPNGATGDNALATPWSDWSEVSRFSVLPQGEQILVGKLAADYLTSVATIEWGPVVSAASYEVWVNRVSDGKQILHQSGLSGLSYQPEPLDPDNYRVWVRATYADGTRTTWSKPKEFTVYGRRANITSPYITHDATPVIEWDTVPNSTRYRITLIDSAKDLAAASIRFDSPEAYRQFITAYSRTVVGSSSSHTVETPLEPGQYRIELTLFFANGTAIQNSSQLEIEPESVPIQVAGTDSVRWNSADAAVSYDIWVAYLGFEGLPQQDTVIGLPQWRFTTADEVTTGSWQLPSDAPAGKYRIWLRPNTESGGHLFKGGWNTPTDIQSSGPLSRPLNIAVQGETLSWNSVPGASEYKITVAAVDPDTEWNYWNGNVTNRQFTVTGTSFQIPNELIDGIYRVWIQALGTSEGSYGPQSESFRIVHGKSPWVWTISNTPDSIEWNAVPDAVSYDIQLTERDTGNIDSEVTGISATLLELPANLEFGHYRVKLRALRSVNGKQFLTEWASQEIDHGINVPTNVRMEGSILKWDALLNSKYEVSIVVANGRMDVPIYFDIAFPIYRPYGPVADTVRQTDVNDLDLSKFIQSVYSYEPPAILTLSVRAISTYFIPNPQYAQTSKWSEPIQFTLPQRPLWTDPIVEQTSRPAASAPLLIPGATDIGRIGIGIPIPGTSRDGTIAIQTTDGFRTSGVGSHIYRTENGAAVDVEYVTRYQLRVTNRETGVVRTFDESQIPELMQLSNESERGFVMPPWYPVDDIAFTGLTVSPSRQLGLQSGVYNFEARVQYLPVILSASTSEPYTTLLTDTTPDHINVAATPWSDWSSPLEYTILPDGQNILPLSKSPATIDQRPSFAWSANTPVAQYELWVENRTTKSRVIHETLSNVREFQSPTNLPAGQYDWWVRIVGTTGPRNGWSAKQSLEIFAPAITTSVVAETVDATPVVSWSTASGAQSYVVTFTSTTTGKVVHQGTEAAGRTSHRVNAILPNDTYNVSIQAILPNGARTAPGAANASGGFVLKRMTVGIALKGVTISTSRVTWQAVNAATRYDVWINYIDSTGKTERILRQDAFGTELPLSASLTNRPGEYRVWIRAIRNEAGQEYIGRWSDVKSLQVNSSSPHSSALEIIMSELAITGILDDVAST